MSINIKNQTIFFPEVTFKRETKVDTTIEPPVLERALVVDGQTMEVKLKIKVTNQDNSLTIELVCIGLFELEEPQDDEVESFMNSNIAPIMILRTREYVALLTENAGLSPLVLPD